MICSTCNQTFTKGDNEPYCQSCNRCICVNCTENYNDNIPVCELCMIYLSSDPTIFLPGENCSTCPYLRVLCSKGANCIGTRRCQICSKGKEESFYWCPKCCKSLCDSCTQFRGDEKEFVCYRCT